MSDQLNLNNMPHSKLNYGDWLALIVPDEISKLRRLHEAIRRWDDVSAAEFEAFQKTVEQRRTPQWDEFGYNPAADEAFMLLSTQRVMFANLGVTIAACVENFVFRVCNALRIECLNAKQQNDFGIACQRLGKSVNSDISTLPGYSGGQRARMLGNCFKHAEGKKSDLWVKKFGGAEGDEIEYENEHWNSMINDSQRLLDGIVSRLS